MQLRYMPSRKLTWSLLLSSIWWMNGAITRCNADAPPSKQSGSSPSYVTAQHDKPKIRSVLGIKAIVRSGPSEKYYATIALPKGATVEVYLETSDGWSGIRPPATSHDWIPASAAYLLPGGKTAEIIADDTPAWIGSESADTPEFMWQTSLSKSQQVEILGEQNQLNDEGKRVVWYKIAPPPGEFRWVKSSQLSDSMPDSQEVNIAENDQPKRENDSNKKEPKILAKDKPKQKSLMKPDPAVKPASHVQEVVTSDPTDAGSQPSGKIVWSDEKEVLAQVQRQIRNEQAEAQQGMPDGDVEVVGSGLSEGTPSPRRTGKSVRPIARNAKPNSTKLDHRTDAMQQWDAMNSVAQKQKVSPVGNILGLIGISVVEADRAPVNARIAQEYHSRSQGDLASMGPFTDRLDRLPRPGHRGPPMTLPSDAAWDSGSALAGQSSAPMTGDSTFSRWLNGREPIFRGANPQANYATATNIPMGHPSVLTQDTPWHGIRGNSITSVPMNTYETRAGDTQASDDVEEFQTPEIQSALVQLTKQVAEPTENWNLVALRGQATRWIEEGSSAMIRGEARLLLDRIDRFESLRQRTLGLAQNTSMLAQQMVRNAGGAMATPNSGVVPASAVGTGMESSQMISNGITTVSGQAGDASGWMVQVHTSYPGQPEFALTDDAGNVITYVQSTAGLNLRRYLQQPVTVYGLRGYVPNLAARQIVAERVVRIR